VFRNVSHNNLTQLQEGVFTDDNALESL